MLRVLVPFYTNSSKKVLLAQRKFRSVLLPNPISYRNSNKPANRRKFASMDSPHLHEREIKYLSQKESQDIDEELMTTEGFSLDQLMELAGLSVAISITKVYPISSHSRPLVVCGPGNNGGDGLVASRHLRHFGYKPTVVYPKQTEKPLYKGLITQCKSLEIPVLNELPLNYDKDFNIVVDAIFGFSFSGPTRAPFDSLIKSINNSKLPVVSVDIPSGWRVNEGKTSDDAIQHPAMLVSLTAPKLCSKDFQGPYHYLGGRFIPPKIAEKYSLNLPPYSGTEQVVALRSYL